MIFNGFSQLLFVMTKQYYVLVASRFMTGFF